MKEAQREFPPALLQPASAGRSLQWADWGVTSSAGLSPIPAWKVTTWLWISVSGHQWSCVQGPRGKALREERSYGALQGCLCRWGELNTCSVGMGWPTPEDRRGQGQRKSYSNLWSSVSESFNLTYLTLKGSKCPCVWKILEDKLWYNMRKIFPPICNIP